MGQSTFEKGNVGAGAIFWIAETVNHGIYLIIMAKNHGKKGILFTILFLMLLGLPLLGIILSRKPIGPYLQFPPRTFYIQHASFSWILFFCYGIFIFAVIMFLFIRTRKGPGNSLPAFYPTVPFPWWGWCGILLGIGAWILAWNRFPWFSTFQIHTFTPLWIAYIITFNALTFRRTGRCLLFTHTSFFILLFPTSAIFWWFFEYLNRFVQNWYYGGNHLSAWQYFWYATLPFSTVLPAVLSTQEWLNSFPWIKNRFTTFSPIPIPNPNPKAASLIGLFLAGVGLLCIGVWPNYLFPLLWISPLLIIVSTQTLFNQDHVLSNIQGGNWGLVLSSALAALICGFFWEMWNYYSFAKWKYNIPYVHRFQVFEMPILGYAGYLPFGVECTAISQLVFGKKDR